MTQSSGASRAPSTSTSSTPMLKVLGFAVSLDGYSAGPNQSLQDPLGQGGVEMMEWYINTLAWRRMHGMEGGEEGTDHAMAELGFRNIGAWILGRNMFGP